MDNVIVTDIDEALILVENEPDHFRVLSIVTPESSAFASNTGTIARQIAAFAKDSLILKFDDATDNWSEMDLFMNSVTLATAEDCRQALQFIERCSGFQECIIHCHAGVSRSTAITLGYLLKKMDTVENAVEELFEMRRCADPNPFVLKLVLKVIGREQEYEYITQQIEQYQSALVY
jgi:predicted protein tyrosine phosphatase